MNQIKSTSEVTLTDLRRLGLQGDATARLGSGEEMSIIQILFTVIFLASGILVYMTFIPNKLSDKISRELKDYSNKHCFKNIQREK